MTITNLKVQKEPCDKNHPCVTIEFEALQKAVSELNGAGLALWCYLVANQNGDSLKLSPADAAKWGITRSSFYRAKDELTQLEYIKFFEGNDFTFYENPRSNF